MSSVVSPNSHSRFLFPRSRGIDRARWPFESIDAVRIPALNIFTGEVLSLFANRVACGDAVQAGENSGLRCGFHYAKG